MYVIDCLDIVGMKRPVLAMMRKLLESFSILAAVKGRRRIFDFPRPC